MILNYQNQLFLIECIHLLIKPGTSDNKKLSLLVTPGDGSWITYCACTVSGEFPIFLFLKKEEFRRLKLSDICSP